MTIRELALHTIEHADIAPDIIDLDRAAQIIGRMNPASGLPDDLTPEAFMAAWNEIVQDGAYEDNWS